MKKLFSVMLVLAMLCGMLVLPASAAGSGSLSMSSATGNRGDTVSLSVYLNSNPGLVTMTIRVSYDTSVLQLIGVSNSGLLVGAQLNPTYGSPYTISWVDGTTTTNNTATGTIATFTFKILDNAKIGDSTVSLQFIDSYDAEYGENAFGASSGRVSVVCKTHIYGDWTKIDDTNHGKTCSVCQNVEKEGHKWNSGTVTKAATCKEEGVKTYTCTICNATKTESIAKTNDHNYGSWTNASDTQHKHVCSVCAKEETANHSWDNVKVTKEPTCKEEGEKTYTCSGCKATKTEVIAKTNDHKYGSWISASDTQHKHVCSVCAKEETANHSWDNVKVTKEPTCKEEGEKTYTCSGCSATKTEVIAKTNDHKYGSWINANDTQHKQVCSVCAKEESAKHSWNSGVVTTKPTCKETGMKTFTCTGCGATKEEVLEKLTTHTWDHACDTECNVCGLTRETTHQYKTSWSKDKTNHWHECSACKDKIDVEAHAPGAAATETRAQTCTTCGYVIKAALGHKHKYSEKWTTDEKGHWYACSGCNEKGSYADHDFENACDPDCSVCGYTRQVAHGFDEKWATDEQNHWHQCSKCGLKQDEAAHEPGAEATATTDQVCTICGYIIEPALGEPETTLAPTQEVLATTAPTEPAADEAEAGAFPWWIVIVAVVLVGGSAIVIAIKKKN